MSAARLPRWPIWIRQCGRPMPPPPKLPNRHKDKSRKAMKTPRSISILTATLLLTTSAAAQISLTPPAVQPPATKPAEPPKEPTKPAQPIKIEPHMVKKPAAPATPAAQAKPATPAAPTAAATPVPEDPNVDLVYGAYQRGQYKTAFDLATPRAQT